MCHFLHVKLMVHVSCPLTKCLVGACGPSGVSVQLVSTSSSCYPWRGAVCFEVQNAGSSLRAELQHQSSQTDFHTSTWAGEHLSVLTNHTRDCDKPLCESSLIFLYGYQSRSNGSLATLTCRPNNLKYLVNNVHHCLFVLLSSVEHLLWNEQPGVRLFRLFAPGVWLTLNHYIRFYRAPILYHASQFSNHCFGHDVNLAPINRNLVMAYRLQIYYFDAASGFWKDTVPQEINQMGIQNCYGGLLLGTVYY